MGTDLRDRLAMIIHRETTQVPGKVPHECDVAAAEAVMAEIGGISEKLAQVKLLAETWLEWSGPPTTEARGCGNSDDERNEASNDAYRDTATRLLAILAMPSEPHVCCGHASDCAVHNAPAEPVGPCNCGADSIESAKGGSRETG